MNFNGSNVVMKYYYLILLLPNITISSNEILLSSQWESTIIQLSMQNYANVSSAKEQLADFLFHFKHIYQSSQNTTFFKPSTKKKSSNWNTGSRKSH